MKILATLIPFMLLCGLFLSSCSQPQPEESVISEAGLPPMPRSPKEGLSGTDVDEDGVRDDVEIAIYKLSPDSVAMRELNRMAANVFQQIITTGSRDDSSQDDAVSEHLARVVSCYRYHSPANAKGMLNIIKSLVIDTPERIDAYEAYLARRNGSAQHIIDAKEEECRLP